MAGGGGEFGRLPREFFARPAPELAPELLGGVLWHDTPEGRVAAVITEVEAYTRTDPASHSYRGKTDHNAVMFGPPGYAYVYFIYGMHFCVNLVCEPDGLASAVLLRAGRITEGAALANERRRNGRGRRGAGAGEQERTVPPRELARGPARLCQALAIDRTLNGADVCTAGSPLGFGSLPAASLDVAGEPDPAAEISNGPRVGISQAADVPWRFWLAAEPSVSTYRRSVPRRRPPKPVAGGTAEDGTMHG
jgi:DNA-3-methyladenine glycosylase